ncbi:MAG: universal stress protein [Deltaproteobacteria bacterium]|nr:universal stress protein [Deltaproteobacteria bacterium]
MNILVGYDGSNVSMSAVKLALKHGELNQTEIDVVRIKAQSPTLLYEEIQKVEREFEDEIENLLKDTTSKYHTHMIVTTQSSGEALVEFARKNQSLEIIIGVRRRSKVGKLFFGSTAQYVILSATCPVVSIK